MLQKISVIVPVYKVEAYLRECVDSIITQTYTNLEIILVDDSSPDNCGKICDDYAKKDDRVRVIHKQNGGVSSARNAGLDIALGEFITFVDSDDWLELDMIELLYNNLIEYNADISSCNLFMSYVNVRSNKINFMEEYEILMLDNKQAIEAILLNKYMTVGSVCKLYRNKIISELRFPEDITCAEDMLFVFEALMKSTIIVCDSKSKYYYRQRKGSKIHDICNTKKINDEIEISKYIVQKIEEKYCDISHVAKDRLLTVKLRILYELISLKNYKHIPEYKQIVSELLKDYKFYIKGNEYRKKNKIALLLLKINVNLYYFIANLYTKKEFNILFD